MRLLGAALAGELEEPVDRHETAPAATQRLAERSLLEDLLALRIEHREPRLDVLRPKRHQSPAHAHKMTAPILLHHNALDIGRPHDVARLHVRQFGEAKRRLEVPRIAMPVVVIAHEEDDGFRGRAASTGGADRTWIAELAPGPYSL